MMVTQAGGTSWRATLEDSAPRSQMGNEDVWEGQTSARSPELTVR